MNEKDETKKQKDCESKDNTEQKTRVMDDWAETASQELSDYIEEQGIQIRY